MNKIVIGMLLSVFVLAGGDSLRSYQGTPNKYIAKKHKPQKVQSAQPKRIKAGTRYSKECGDWVKLTWDKLHRANKLLNRGIINPDVQDALWYEAGSVEACGLWMPDNIIKAGAVINDKYTKLQHKLAKQREQERISYSQNAGKYENESLEE